MVVVRSGGAGVGRGGREGCGELGGDEVSLAGG